MDLLLLSLPMLVLAAAAPAGGGSAPPFDGVVEGGWAYVAAAYGLSLLVLLGYSVVVTVRLRGLQARPGPREEGR